MKRHDRTKDPKEHERAQKPQILPAHHSGPISAAADSVPLHARSTHFSAFANKKELIDSLLIRRWIATDSKLIRH